MTFPSKSLFLPLLKLFSSQKFYLGDPVFMITKKHLYQSSSQSKFKILAGRIYPYLILCFRESYEDSLKYPQSKKIIPKENFSTRLFRKIRSLLSSASIFSFHNYYISLISPWVLLLRPHLPHHHQCHQHQQRWHILIWLIKDLILLILRNS